jgi:hypothetical protein
MTTIEIFALIIALIAGIKILVILVSPKTWLNSVVKPIYSKSTLMGVIAFILAAIVLYYLLQEITIIEIFAVMLFICLLAATGFSVYYKEVLGLAGKLVNKAVVKKSWFYIIIWIILIVWVLYSLFA